VGRRKKKKNHRFKEYLTHRKDARMTGIIARVGGAKKKGDTQKKTKLKKVLRARDKKPGARIGKVHRVKYGGSFGEGKLEKIPCLKRKGTNRVKAGGKREGRSTQFVRSGGKKRP